ncbi:MAG: hypothetical protein RL517_1288, partial [Pseudomonadota bacterium]
MMNAYLQSIALIEMSISCAVVLVWLVQKVSKTEMPVAIRLALLLILGNLFFWPIGLSLELPLSAYVRGVTGDLSIVTLLLLWGSILPASQKTPLGFKVSVAFLAIVFYPLALGFGMFDPYALGYGSLGLLIAVIILAVICGLAGWV